MRSRQRVLEILHGRGGGLVAFDALRDDSVARLIDTLPLDAAWRDYFVNGDIRYVGCTPPALDRAVFAPYLPTLPAAADLSFWGIGSVPVKTAAGLHAGHQYWHPLATVDTVEELAAFPFPELDDETRTTLRNEVRQWQAAGYAIVGNASQTILETAYLMRGLEQLFADFHERPDYIEALFARLTALRVQQVQAMAEAGVDAIRIGDDIATQTGLMISLPMYRRTLKPGHAAIVDAARAIAPDLPIAYHSDGNIAALLPELLELGITAINPVQPEAMDLRQTKQSYGAQLALWGCTAVQSIFAHGSAAEVRAHTRFLIDELARDHGVIIQFMNIILTPQVMSNLGVFFTEYADALAPARRQKTPLTAST